MLTTHHSPPLGGRLARVVLGVIAQGRSNAAIARELTVTLGAVEKHISNIFSKLDLSATDDDRRRVLAVLTSCGRRPSDLSAVACVRCVGWRGSGGGGPAVRGVRRRAASGGVRRRRAG